MSDNNKVSRQRESFSSNRLIHEAIIVVLLVIGLISLCTGLYASLVLSWCLLPSSKSIDFSSFDPFGSGKILRLWL